MANNKVSPPTLPKNIKKIRIQRDRVDNVGVIPNVSPTVPMAEADSKRASSIGSWSIDEMKKAPKKNKTINNMKRAAALFSVSDFILRPKHCGLCL